MPSHRRKPAIATWSSPPPSYRKPCCWPGGQTSHWIQLQNFYAPGTFSLNTQMCVAPNHMGVFTETHHLWELFISGVDSLAPRLYFSEKVGLLGAYVFFVEELCNCVLPYCLLLCNCAFLPLKVSVSAFCLGTVRLSLTCMLQSAVQPVLCQCATVNHLNKVITFAE